VSEQIPKFRSIAQKLRSQVTSGALAPGTPLASRRRLAKDFQTSRVTIDKVVELLTAEGVFEPSDGNRPPVVADISQRVVSVQDRVDSHATNGRALRANEVSKILSVEKTPCPADIAPLLGVAPGKEVLCRTRLNLVDDHPDATGYSYYPPEVVELVPELAQPESLPEGSRELVSERMGSRQKYRRDIVTSRLATDRERELLQLGGTLNVVTQDMRHVTLANGKVIEVAVKITEGNRPISFLSEL
jgi:GntR family transcriptional regulator